MIFDNLLHGTSRLGYITGISDGIVTVNGVPTKRDIVLLDTKDLSVLKLSQSFDNGHYLLNGLDPNQKYMVMARDHNKEYRAAVFDYVTPATDLTIAQQQELWQSWQEEQPIQYSLTLNVTDNKQPSQTEVFLFNQADKRLVGKGMTNTDGKVTFYTTDNSNKYFAVSFYKNDSKRARIQDRLTPTAITN